MNQNAILKKTGESVGTVQATRFLSPCYKHEKRLSFGERGTGNCVIQGDNLPILQHLSEHMPASIKCIYIDPPYNNGETYTHYSDRMGHEEWLESVAARIRLLATLLRHDGSLWVSIDESELHYLKVECDRIFGRKNFVSTLVWEHRTSRENRKVFSNNHEYILVYAKNYEKFKSSRNALPLTAEIKARYKNPDNDSRGPWQSVSANVQAGHATAAQFYEIEAPNGKSHRPPNGRCWVYAKNRMQNEIDKNNVWFGRSGNNVPRLKKFLSERKSGVTPETLWSAEAVKTTNSAKKHLLKLFTKRSPFDTPKPEELLSRILQIASNPGDAVLDAYLGSGTTAAVAHKLNRSYIGIENGEHARTYCAERLRLVVEGECGGVSGAAAWLGGGGFDFYSHSG